MSKSLTNQQAMRYNRHIVLPKIDLDGQEALLNANICIIGIKILNLPISVRAWWRNCE